MRDLARFWWALRVASAAAAASAVDISRVKRLALGSLD